MAISNFVPALWSGVILKAFEKAFVYASLVNRNYEGEISGPGDRVRIATMNNVAVRTYVKGTDITFDDLDGTYQDFVIDQAKYFALKLEDIDALQAKPAMMAESVRLAGVAIADTVDAYVAGIMASGASITTNLGTSTTPLDVNSAAVPGLLALVGEALDNANVPRAGRWIVLPPWGIKKLALSKIVQDTNNSEALASGFVGHYMGFEVHMSPNVPNTTGAKWQVVAGTNEATTYADQIAKTEALRLENSFSDAMRGLYVYAAKVVRPTTLALAYLNEAAEV